jgi:serine/threonine protein kinase/tetratricopeptide (TPR) repeat protein
MKFSPGTRLGAFEIVGSIGAGGMGEVYRARDTRLDRTVAIKVIGSDSNRDPDLAVRFEREARTASALNHPNIVTIYEIGETDAIRFIAMEFVEGQTLRELMALGPLPLRKGLGLAAQVADGLAKAHQAGVVHRDLKPENVMVNTDGLAKIMDFGLAKPVAPGPQTLPDTVTGSVSLTQAGVVLGSVAYMSPEQASGRPVDARSDQFALGLILYEMVTGRRAFRKATAVQTLAAIIEEEPESVATLNPKAPPALQQIIRRCLAKDPIHRYASTADLARDLEGVRDLSTGSSPLQTPPIQAPRRPRLTMAGSALGIIAIGALGVGWGLWTVHRGGRSAESRPTTVVPFAHRDWLLVADFDNQTGEEIFDKSLGMALAVSISQSSYVNLVPASRIRDALQRMKRPDAQRVDTTVAREIAQREGFKLVLAPGISGVGGVYLLSASLVDPSSGAAITSVVVNAASAREVLNALGELADQVRRNLGETPSTVSKQSKPLMEVTTSSLDALKRFSLAVEQHSAQKFDVARTLYEEALRIDPSFTSAKVSLGMIQFEFFDRERGKAMLAEAIQRADSLTEIEKYQTLAFHAQAVEGNLPKAAEYWKSLLAMYPDRATAHNNLGRVYQQMGEFTKAVAEYKETIRLDPRLMLTYYSLNEIYVYQTGDLDAAIALSKQQLSYDDRNVWAYDFLGWAHLGKGSLEEARSAFAKALEIDPRSVVDWYRLGHTYRLLGRYTDALHTFLKIPDIDARETDSYYHAGIVSDLAGNRPAARQYFERFRRETDARVRRNPGDADARFSLALVAARLGQDSQAASVGQQAMRAAMTEADAHFNMARLLAVRGQTSAALDELDRAVARGFHDYVAMKINDDFQPIVRDPQYQALLARLLKSTAR